MDSEVMVLKWDFFFFPFLKRFESRPPASFNLLINTDNTSACDDLILATEIF